MQQKQPSVWQSRGHSDLGLGFLGFSHSEHWMEGACQVTNGFYMTSEQNTYNTRVKHFSL